MISPEQAVLAAIVLNPSVLRLTIAEGLFADDFADPRLALIYDGLTAMVGADEAVDAITVGERLLGWGVRGIRVEDIYAWTSEVFAPETYGPEYARDVRAASVRRTLISIGETLAEQARADDPLALAHATDAAAKVRVGRQVYPGGDVLKVFADNQDETRYRWVIPGLLEETDRLMITGGEGGGKTTLVRQLSLLSSAGIHPFGFEHIPQVSTLVIDCENTARQWTREVEELHLIESMKSWRGQAPKMHLRNIPRLDLTRDSDLAAVHHFIDECHPSLVAIGPLYRLIPRAINNDDDAAPLLAALDTIRERGPALIIEAHAGHATTGEARERDLRPRGSSALLGWPEFGFGLRQAPGGNGSEWELKRWRGDRVRRSWPERISRGPGQPFPWVPTLWKRKDES